MFDGHTHYVMQIAFNPKDNNTFATASLDRTLKVWNLGSNVANFTLEGHEKGVNCVDYYHGSDKPYLISGADDHLVKVWDYQNKTCVQTLEVHVNNVTTVCFHPELPIALSGMSKLPFPYNCPISGFRTLIRPKVLYLGNLEDSGKGVGDFFAHKVMQIPNLETVFESELI